MDQQTNVSNLSLVWNNSQQALVYTLRIIDNVSEEDVAPRMHLLAFNQLASPAVIVSAILLVFLFSPTIIIGNSLVLIAIYRFKRLRTPSNYLVMSLATSDLGVGMYMPVGMFMELCDIGGVDEVFSARVCLINYSVFISLCCVSVLVMVAIAVDRFTSLARPLRYNNLITHTAMERYIAVFWVYATFVGISPFTYNMFYGTSNYQFSNCSFGSLIPRPIQLFMFCAVYGPSAFILVVCYGYIYVVARGHARAISEVRHSLQHGSSAPRYGLALAITTGMFLTLWLPFQICMLLDVFTDSKILSHWIVIYLALPILSSSAFNPWIYGYRNAELRLGVQKVVDDMLTLLGFNYRSHPITDAHVVPPSVAATAGDAGSFVNHQPNCNHAHHQQNHQGPSPLSPEYDQDSITRKNDPPIRREYYSWNPDDEFLLVPMAKLESSGFQSLDDEKCPSPRSISLTLNYNQFNKSGKSINNNQFYTQQNNANYGKMKYNQKNSRFNFIKDFKDSKDIDCHNVKDITNFTEMEGKDKKAISKQKKEFKADIKKPELERYKNFDMKYSRMKLDCCNQPGLKGSKSMIESFAGIRNGTDVWIFKGKNLMINGASIV